MSDLNYELEFLHDEVEILLTEGIEAVDRNVILDEEAGRPKFWFALETTENVDNPYRRFENFLEKGGYEGERLETQSDIYSYIAPLDKEGLEIALQQPYVNSVELL